MDGLKKIIEFYGTQKRAAEALGVTQPTVSNWLRGHAEITAKRARDIERRTNGAVKAAELLGL